MSEPLIYQLFAYPNTYSMGIHLMLEESGLPYQIINPKSEPSITDKMFYRASPHGRVPALILPNGTTMCESSAIAFHLAETITHHKFSVPIDSVDRCRYLQWLFYLSSTLQPDVMLVFHPENYFANNVQQTALIKAAEKRLESIWTVLEKEYSKQDHLVPWMFESGPTAVDFSLATVLLWPECFPRSSNAYPALNAMIKTLSDRASFKRIMPWHQGLIDKPSQRLTLED